LYYVFFDTVDTALVRDITRKFSDIVINKLYDDFKSLLQPGTSSLDASKMADYFKNGMGKMFDFLNCYEYFGQCCASCPDCCKAHIVVLATNQLESVTEGMEDVKRKFQWLLKVWCPKDEKQRERVSFQTLCQNWSNASLVNVARIAILKRYSPRSDEYFEKYTSAARGYTERDPNDFFKYVRANGIFSFFSHYTKFRNALNSPSNLTLCNNLP